MPAYLIVLRKEPIRNTAEMAEYQRKSREKPPAVKLTPMVVSDDVACLEGTAPDAVVMLQFDTVDDAKAWYESADYQAALPHRLKAADYDSFIVPGF